MVLRVGSRIPVLALVCLTFACAPISPERAADLCEDRARAATGPTGYLRVGVDSRGKSRTGVSIGVSTDFLTGADPQVVYEDCVRQRTGQGPIRPLVL